MHFHSSSSASPMVYSNVTDISQIKGLLCFSFLFSIYHIFIYPTPCSSESLSEFILMLIVQFLNSKCLWNHDHLCGSVEIWNVLCSIYPSFIYFLKEIKWVYWIWMTLFMTAIFYDSILFENIAGDLMFPLFLFILMRATNMKWKNIEIPILYISILYFY